METSPRSQLDQARKAFERGDYASVRRFAAPLAHPVGSSEDDSTEHHSAEVAEEARELLKRLTPHRITKLFFLVTLLLLSAVTFFAYSR